ncbi:hypothetical protein ACFOY2_22450 [Nonomuraea purpurea]|uniref:Uncharacterized protein n=1 Tax=Nonomuraea purpurea TaxID=1849276 RepID=A0ABV8G7M9_9ACTN
MDASSEPFAASHGAHYECKEEEHESSHHSEGCNVDGLHRGREHNSRPIGARAEPAAGRRAGKLRHHGQQGRKRQFPEVLANATVIIRLFDLLCDFAGYRIKDLGHWNNRASSFLTGNGCNAVNIHNDSNFLDYGTGFRNPRRAQHRPAVHAPGFDNNVQSIALWRM